MAGLHFKGPSARSLANAIAAASREGRADALDEFRQEAEIIKEIGEDQAPVQTGELELAFKVEMKRLRADRTAFNISVGGMVKGIDVDQYAEKVHEGPTHYTPANVAKSARTGRAVGNQFLARAFDERRGIAMQRAFDALVKGVKNHVG